MFMYVYLCSFVTIYLHLVVILFVFFFLNDTAPTEIYTLPLPDALPISTLGWVAHTRRIYRRKGPRSGRAELAPDMTQDRLEEHTSELQSRQYLVCRLLLEKKNNIQLSSRTQLRCQC